MTDRLPTVRELARREVRIAAAAARRRLARSRRSAARAAPGALRPRGAVRHARVWRRLHPLGAGPLAAAARTYLQNTGPYCQGIVLPVALNLLV